MANKKIRIVWETTRGTKHSKAVDETDAQAEMDRLRSLPDVKSGSVRMSM